jgi:phage/plasmid primase-like uncharacterized protein
MTVQVLNHRESDGKCQLCGKQDELRPYGPNGEWICFDCGMKDEATTEAQFAKVLDGAEVTVIDAR